VAGSDHTAGRASTGGEEIDRRLRDASEVLDAVAKRIGRRLGNQIELDELKAFGRQSMLQIVSGYDPSRAAFNGYVAIKLKWAILDGVRRSTHGRALVARTQALMASERVGAALAANPEPPGPVEEEVYQERLRSLLGVHAAALAVGLVTTAGDLAVVADEATSPEDRAARIQAAVALRGAVAELPERERTLIERHYFQGERFDSIAVELGISKSWASRLHAQAIVTLGRVLRELGE
jgi:RNA polymerase sigma factor for flagellar operon FliA